MSWLLDFVPVVGTVKNTVECVDCLLHGDGSGALSKGAQAVIGGALDVATLGTAGSLGKLAAKGAIKGAASKVAIGVGEKAAINVAGRVISDKIVGTGNRQHYGYHPRTHYHYHTTSSSNTSENSTEQGESSTTKSESSARQSRQDNSSRSPSATRQNDRNRSASRTDNSSQNNRSTQYTHRSVITYQELAHVRREGREPDRPGQEKNPARRGEHVINNGVLRIYNDIVRDFVSDVLGDNLDEMVNSGRLSEQSEVLQAIENPVPERIANMIQNQLVVHMDCPFIDTNAIAYGEAVQQLRDVLGSYMEEILNRLNDPASDNNLSGIERNVRDVVEEFIAEEYYIDGTALEKWRSEHRGSDKIDVARAAVERMLRKLIYDRGKHTVIEWVRELLEASKRRRR